MTYDSFIDQVLEKHLSSKEIVERITPISGGCINSTYRVTTDIGDYFLKWNDQQLHEMFLSELKGLLILNEKSELLAPQPLGEGILKDRSYLLTEWIEKGARSSGFWESFAEGLANQHKNSEVQFGLDHNNFIGSLKQSNRNHTSWYDFFVEERLQPQVKLASSKSLISDKLLSQFGTLYTKLENLIPKEAPALLHGDLWSGNFMIDQSGKAAIFDPSVHYGHRETELAFTKLFGGFSRDFYSHYHESFPMEPGFEERVDIHNLYPLLVHVNLFGGSYLHGIIQTLNRYC